MVAGGEHNQDLSPIATDAHATLVNNVPTDMTIFADAPTDGPSLPESDLERHQVHAEWEDRNWWADP